VAGKRRVAGNDRATLDFMMRLRRVFCIAIVLSWLFVLPASAQTPDTGLIAVGADIGVLFPDEAFEKTFTFDAYGEYFLTPRISVRGMFAWANPGFENFTEDHYRQAKFLFNGLYNWDRQEWHPFVTAGAGAYFVRENLTGAFDPDSEVRGGLNFGGGAEYFVGDRASVKGEVRWDIVSQPPGLADATGFSLTIGYKRYF
jgi:hypothetical protein